MTDPKIINLTENMQIVISSTNPKLFMYENYLLNDHNRKINLFNRFVDGLKIDEPLLDKFKTFCNKLHDDNMAHLMVKYTIADHYSGFHNVNKCNMILRNIFDNNFTDFTINFSDKSHFECLKTLLETIQYFSIIFNDLDEFKNSITLNVDPNIAIIIFKLLYGFDVMPLITINNFCDVLKLMDVWLMDKLYMDQILLFTEKNMDDLITFLLSNEKYDDIAFLVNTFSYNVNISKILKHDFKDKIFIFDDWQTKFSCEQKIEAIKLSGKFELLNIAKINPEKIMYLLMDSNSNFMFETIYMMMTSHKNTKVYFKKIDDDTDDKLDIVVLIDEYYPKFIVNIYTRSDVKYNNKVFTFSPNANIFTFSHPFRKINVGHELLVGNNLKLIYDDPTHKYTITKMMKGEQSYEFMPYKLLHDIKVTHNIDEKCNGYVWVKKILKYNLVNKIDISSI
jgi:hypothetical protein